MSSDQILALQSPTFRFRHQAMFCEKTRDWQCTNCAKVDGNLKRLDFKKITKEILGQIATTMIFQILMLIKPSDQVFIIIIFFFIILIIISLFIILIIIIIIRDRKEIFCVARVSLKGTYWPVVGSKAEVLVLKLIMMMTVAMKMTLTPTMTMTVTMTTMQILLPLMTIMLT